MKRLIQCAVVLILALTVHGSQTGAAQNKPNIIEIHAKRFAFSPNEITIKKGEEVTLDLTSEDVRHSLFVEGLGINMPIKKGTVSRVTITPKEAGDFQGRCGSFCGIGHGSMVFTVHVTGD